jgi:hypothetical protein
MVCAVADEVIGVQQGLLGETLDVLVVEGVEEAVAVSPDVHHLGESELGEVLRHRWWAGADVLRELVDRALTVE